MSYLISANQLRNSFEAGNSSGFIMRFGSNGSNAIDPNSLNIIKSGTNNWAPVSEFSMDDYTTLTHEVTVGGALDIGINIPIRTKWSPSSISLTLYDTDQLDVFGSFEEWVGRYNFNTDSSKGRAPTFEELASYSLKLYIYYLDKKRESLGAPGVYYVLPPNTMSNSYDSGFSVNSFQVELPCIGREDHDGD